MPMHITTENAKELAAKGNAIRWENWRKQQASLAVAGKPQAIPMRIAETVADDGYKAKRLTRVRVQLDAIDKQIHEQTMRKKPDGQTLNWLATAQARLSEQERILSGRPLPGSLKPSSKTDRPRSQSLPEPESAAPGADLLA